MNLNLVIEILIGGIYGAIWILLIICKLLNMDIPDILLILKSLDSSNYLVYALATTLVYVLGWVMHYICDFVFNTPFEKSIRKKVFGSDNAFFEARGNVFLRGSDNILYDINFDRQLIRIARENALNFLMISLTSLLYIRNYYKEILIFACFSFLISIISFMQWKQRYISTYHKIYRANESIKSVSKSE